MLTASYLQMFVILFLQRLEIRFQHIQLTHISCLTIAAWIIRAIKKKKQATCRKLVQAALTLCIQKPPLNSRLSLQKEIRSFGRLNVRVGVTKSTSDRFYQVSVNQVSLIINYLVCSLHTDFFTGASFSFITLFFYSFRYLKK